MWSSKWSIVAAITLLGCSAGQEKQSATAPQKVGNTIVYFQNGSDTEPEANLEIRRNDSVLFSGPILFNNIPDDWHSLTLPSKYPTQRISVVNKQTGTRLDTLVQSSDSLTHVFLTYDYHKLTPSEILGFKKNAHNTTEEKAMRAMFARPRGFSVLVMQGSVSIP